MQDQQAGPFRAVLLLLSIFAYAVHGQTSTVNGIAEYLGTPVRTNPLGIPTLSYNCAKLPSICNNVHAVYPLNAGAVAGTKTTLQNRQYIELNIDRDTERKDRRRGQVCPDLSWRRNHPCPEQDQPLVVPQPFNNGARSYSGGFIGQRLHPNTDDYTIANSNGADTGMAWSCDEFPPAISTEGGINALTGVAANTYCAPMFHKVCAGPNAGRYTRSEQDFQASSHSRIRNNAWTDRMTPGIFTVHFTTAFIDDDNAWATSVDFYTIGGVTRSQYGRSKKRSDLKYLVSHRHYGNGTEAHVVREVPMNHGMPGGPRDTDALSEHGILEKRMLDAPIFTEILEESNQEASHDLVERNSDACVEDTPLWSNMTTLPVVLTTFPASATATPSCSLQKQDPNEGVTSQYCVCQGSATLPALISITGSLEVQNCAYTAIPNTTAFITPTTSLGPATTFSALCEVCAPAVINEDSCTTIKGCVPSAGVANMTAASSHVHVGTLTASNLYTAISNALETACPSVTQTTAMTQCTGEAVTVAKNVEYIEDLNLETDGELTITVQWSQYNESSLRDAMIQGIAQGMMLSAANANCYNASYNVETIVKRDPHSRRLLVVREEALRSGSLSGRADHPMEEREEKVHCNAVSAIQFSYWDPWWRQAPTPGATDYISAELGFHIGPSGQFLCELWEGMTDALAALQPEFAVEDIELGEAITFYCESDLSDPS